MNTNAGGPPNVGDPFEVYLDRFAPPADPLTLPQSGLALSFDDTGSLPGVTGTATYTGSLGPVSETRPIVIHVFRDADLTDRLIETRFIVENGGSFGLILFESIEHFVVAFLDLNQNEERDEGEPFTIYDGRATPPGDPIPEDGSMLEITFGDEGLPTPTSTPTATATPTPETSCVGDCNNDGEVTVDELVIGASIALGVADLSECPEFDADSNGSVTVDELLQSVANLLGGCPDN